MSRMGTPALGASHRSGLRFSAGFTVALSYRRRSDWQIPLWTTTAVGGILFGLVIWLVGPEVFSLRHPAALFVPLLLSAFAIARIVGFGTP